MAQRVEEGEVEVVEVEGEAGLDEAGQVGGPRLDDEAGEVGPRLDEAGKLVVEVLWAQQRL